MVNALWEIFHACTGREQVRTFLNIIQKCGRNRETTLDWHYIDKCITSRVGTNINYLRNVLLNVQYHVDAYSHGRTTAIVVRWLVGIYKMHVANVFRTGSKNGTLLWHYIRSCRIVFFYQIRMARYNVVLRCFFICGYHTKDPSMYLLERGLFFPQPDSFLYIEKQIDHSIFVLKKNIATP